MILEWFMLLWSSYALIEFGERNKILWFLKKLTIPSLIIPAGKCFFSFLLFFRRAPWHSQILMYLYFILIFQMLQKVSVLKKINQICHLRRQKNHPLQVLNIIRSLWDFFLDRLYPCRWLGIRFLYLYQKSTFIW